MGNLRFALPAVIMLFITIVPAMGDIESDWDDFLHYTAIGKFDLASGYADNILGSEPDPVVLLGLSEKNPRAYSLLLNIYNNNEQLQDSASKLIDLIEEGRYLRRIDPAIIRAEIARLNTTIRGRMKAETRLKNAGEYAVLYMLDAMADDTRKDELANIIWALPQVGTDAIRPLTTALQTDNAAVRAEIVKGEGAAVPLSLICSPKS